MEMISQYCSFDLWKWAWLLSNAAQELHSAICVQRAPLPFFDQVLKGNGVVIPLAAQVCPLELDKEETCISYTNRELKKYFTDPSSVWNVSIQQPLSWRSGHRLLY